MAYQDALDALGDPTRRAVLELLRAGPKPVGQVAADLPITRPGVSQHLRVLKEAGLVIDRRDGTRRIYEVVPDGLVDVAAYLGTFWSKALDSFSSAAQGAGGETK